VADERIDLARRADFQLGSAVVRPSIRAIETPDCKLTLEPRVMQVLIVLSDADGTVLSRDDLLRTCWQGRIVGDDAINRAVAEVRRTAETLAAGFQVETIPRVGYRLNVNGAPAVAIPGGRPHEASSTRRQLVAVSAGAILALGAGGYGLVKWRRDSTVDRLIKQGREVQARGTGTAPFAQSEGYFRQALNLEPGRADAWGLLSSALTSSITDVPPQQRGRLLQEASDAATRALAIDPREPNARTSLALLRRGLDDWIEFEREIRAVLADFPKTYFALMSLAWFFQGVGRCSESWDLNERALAIEPLSPNCQFRRAFKHWIFGRTAEADRISARAFELWPREPNVWNARLTILAFTGRPAAARQLLEDTATRPRLSHEALLLWQQGLTALETGSPADRLRARDLALDTFANSPGVAANAVMLMSSIGEVTAAYQIAEGLMLNKGRQAGSRSSGAPTFYADAGWRGTQWLFTPATRAMRYDARFTGLCEAMGYRGYWRKRGVWPDAFVRGSLVTR
jgi:DNA-binding winged helix-turn-helix (wHTH) protein/tetratricopeptide (TPR) repeat protein